MFKDTRNLKANITRQSINLGVIAKSVITLYRDYMLRMQQVSNPVIFHLLPITWTTTRLSLACVHTTLLVFTKN